MIRQNKIIVVLALTMVLIFIVFKKREGHLTFSLGTPVEQSSSERKEPQIVKSEKTIPFSSGGTAYQALVKKDRAEKLAGLKRMALPKEGELAQLKIVISIKPICNPGDADAILMDLKAAPNHKLLATLEDLSGKGKSLSWDIPSSLFKEKKAENIFKVPVSSEPTQYGFFICTANESDTTCSDKEVKDVNEIFTEHLTKKVGAGQELRNIFFQYFLVDERGLAAFTEGVNGRGNQVFDRLKKYVDEVKAPGKANRAEIDFAKNALKKIDSLPSVFSGDKLVLLIPKFTGSACQ